MSTVVCPVYTTYVYIPLHTQHIATWQVFCIHVLFSFPIEVAQHPFALRSESLSLQGTKDHGNSRNEVSHRSLARQLLLNHGALLYTVPVHSKPVFQCNVGNSQFCLVSLIAEEECFQNSNCSSIGSKMINLVAFNINSCDWNFPITVFGRCDFFLWNWGGCDFSTGGGQQLLRLFPTFFLSQGF